MDALRHESSLEVEWELLTKENPGLAARYMDIMADMDAHYRVGVEEACRWMVEAGRYYYLGSGDGFELALGLTWKDDRKRFFVQSVGFRGDITPHDAVEFFVRKAIQFLNEHGESTLSAIVPSKMDNPNILRFYDVLLWRSDIEAVGGRPVEGGTYWRLRHLAQLPVNRNHC